MDETYFNKIFKEAMDEMGVSPSELADKAERTRTNISAIRGGRSFPNLNDFVRLLNCCEDIKPGFKELFVRMLLGETRRQTLNPEELIASLDSTELGALLIAAGSRMTEARFDKTESRQLATA
jgi:hypothetical protein